MDPGDWRQIEALVDAALPLPPKERARFLADKCGGDETFHAHICKLLEDPESLTTFGKAIQDASNGIDQTLDDSWIGRRIGPYRVIRPLGRGGMGVVFLAVRDDAQFQQQVAIKVLKFEASNVVLRTRFRQERQILAGLAHPNIARLLDGGSSEEGAPYLVMEFVAGVTITDYCDACSLTVKDRARLFLKVCDAVQYAHQNLVVHRDIKPGNILVTPEGAPKLLDFGIAKMLDPGPAFGDVPETATGMMLMTPEYASPEQVRGEASSTAADVYSLGVVFYQLLTGQRPYNLDARNPLEVGRIISEEPPQPPGLGDELDHILLMALRKEPERRYGSAREFADDIQRWLDDWPVLARPDTVHYRVTKYIRRNPFKLAAATALILAIGIGVGASQYQARRAERRFEQVRSLANWFIFDLDRKTRALQGATPLREEIVQKGLEYLRELSEDSVKDPALAAELARGYLAVAEAQGDPTTPSLGHFDQAIQSYTRASEIAENLEARHQASPAARETLGTAYAKIGDIHVLWGDRTEAIKFYGKAISLAERSEAAGHPQLGVLSYAQFLTGNTRIADGDPKGAMEAMSDSLRSAARWNSGSPGEPAQTAMARAIRGQARAAKIGGDWKLAIAKSNEADEIALRLYRLHPTDPAHVEGLIASYLGAMPGVGLPADLDDYVIRNKQLEQAAELAWAAVKANPKNYSTYGSLSLVLFNQGLAVRRANPRQALENYRAAIATASNAIALGAMNSHVEANLALFDTFVGETLEELGEFRPALQSLRKALATQEKLGNTTLLAELSGIESLIHISQVELRLQNGQAAFDALQRAHEEARTLQSAHPRDIRMTYYLAECYEGLGKWAMEHRDRQQAREWFAKSFEIWTAWAQRGVSTQYDVDHKIRAARLLANAQSADL